MSIEDRVRKVVSEQLDVSGEIDNNASFIDEFRGGFIRYCRTCNVS